MLSILWFCKAILIRNFSNCLFIYYNSVLHYHQKYFLLENENGDIDNKFAFVANGDRGAEANESIIKGNERVLNARLEDALFFVTKDLASDWNDWLTLLERQVFHQKLGMMSVRINHLGRIGRISMSIYQSR